jgi:nitroreductase
MNDEARPTPSALQAWASGVMAGKGGSGPEVDADVDRAPGQAQYDPADVISVFMGARESAKQRDAQARRNPVRLRRGRSQPS